jgi:hypothetical protein
MVSAYPALNGASIKYKTWLCLKAIAGGRIPWPGIFEENHPFVDKLDEEVSVRVGLSIRA